MKVKNRASLTKVKVTTEKRLILANKELAKKNFELVKISRLYAFISQINQHISHVKDEKKFFLNACKIARKFGGFKMAWVGMFNSDKREINLVDQSGISSKDIKLFKNTPFPKGGPQDRVLTTQKHFICNDILNDLKVKEWKSFAVKHGIKSVIVLPVKKSGITIGSFNLYSTVYDFFNKEEIALLVELTGDISFALDKFEKERMQKKTDELVLDNEKKFRGLIEKSGEMIVLSTQRGELTYGSRSVEYFLGYKPEEYLHRPASDFIHIDDLSGYYGSRKIVIKAKGKSFHHSLRLKHKNGNWIWCEGSVTNLLHDKSINALVSNFRDISEEKAAEQQREFDKNNLDALINNTKDLMWSVDRDFKLITSNEPFNQMIKLLPGNKNKKKESDLYAGIPKEKIERFKGYYKRAFKGEFFTKVEHEKIPSETWAEISFYPIFKDNKVVGTACHSRDITQIKSTMLLLKKSEAFNSGVLNSLDSHVAVVDGFGSILTVNESWKKFASKNGGHGLSGTNEGVNYYEVCEKSSKEGAPEATDVLNGIKAVMEKKRKLFYMEYPCHSPSEKRWFGMRVLKFKSDQPMVVISHENITQRKLVEEKVISSEFKIRNFARHLNDVLEEERARLAREIHDELGQQLVGIKMKLSLFLSSDAEKNIIINNLKKSVDNTIQSLRIIATELRPGILDSLGLASSIEWLVEEFEKRTNVKCVLKLNMEEQKIGMKISTCFFRICQEALTNISKHAEATKVKINILQNNEGLQMKICDNGKGINKEKLENPLSMGLLGMNERANIIGAELKIVSNKNTGTIVLLKSKKI